MSPSDNADTPSSTSVPILSVEIPGRIRTGTSPSAPGIPPLVFASPRADDAEGGRRARAQVHNREGLRLHKTNRAAATDAYRSALEIDPGHEYARYNLACAMALDHDERALLLLEELVAAGTKVCIDLVAQASSDKDFRTLVDHPRFRAAVDAAKAAQKSQRFATFDVSLKSDTDGHFAQMRALEPESAFRFGERIRLILAEPVRVTDVRVDVLDREFSGFDFRRERVVILPAQPPAHSSGNSGDPLRPLVTREVEVVLGVCHGDETMDCSKEHDLRFTVHAGPVEQPAAAAEPPAPVPPNTVTLAWGEDDKVIHQGFPAVSDDRKLIAYLADDVPNPEYGMLTTIYLHVVDSGNNKLLLKQKIDDGTDASSREAEIRFHIDAAMRRLRELSWRWIPMRPKGSTLDIAVGGEPVRFLATFDAPTLRVIDFRGRELFVSNQPAWARPPKELLHPRMNPTQPNKPTQYDGSAWIDPEFRVLLFLMYFKLLICPGGEHYRWYALRLSPPVP